MISSIEGYHGETSTPIFFEAHVEPVKQYRGGCGDIERICHAEHWDRDNGIRCFRHVRETLPRSPPITQSGRKDRHELWFHSLARCGVFIFSVAVVAYLFGLPRTSTRSI